MRFLRHLAEAAAVWLLYWIFGLLPLDAASWLGSALGRLVGPRIRATRTARANLQRVFPEIGEPELARIISGMWDNLGRTAGEHPHLANFDPRRANSCFEVAGIEHIETLRDDGKAGIFFTGHLANWELLPVVATTHRLKVHAIYRRANNPYFNTILQKRRGFHGGDLYPKGLEGAKSVLRALRLGEHLTLLVDQKMNDGIPVPFLGLNAMTAPAAAELAYRYDCPLVPVRVERLGGARFRVTCYAPLEKPDDGDRQADVAALMGTVNEILADWIRERPEQWFWVHNRWPPE